MKKGKLRAGEFNRTPPQVALPDGERLEVTIERVLPGGYGLAHSGESTVFVYLAAPGDRVLVRVEKTRGAVTWARIEEVIEPSPVRIEPPCPYFGRCGGCDFQQLSYEAQLDAKLEIVRDCLKRITRIEPPADLRIIPSPSEWNYRARAMWQRDRERNLLGYYERGSHNVCDVSYCGVLTPPLQHALGKMRSALADGLIPSQVREILAVEGDTGTAIFPPLDPDADVETSRTIGEFTYRFSADGFFQINHLLLPELIRAAVEPLHGDNVLDLYCGVGLFSLPLAARFGSVIGIESNADAIRYAQLNAANAGFENTTFYSDMVGIWFERYRDTLGSVDAVLLDPPRIGAEKATIRGILSVKPKRISYVSCDPATLARDLRPLLDAGYTLDSITAFDMFPQTHHVEAVVHLKC